MVQDWHDLGIKISEWLRDYAGKNQIKTLVVGVSGGIDSAVVSTLCAKTSCILLYSANFIVLFVFFRKKKIL